MTKATRYPPELRERAIRLVREHRAEHSSEWAVIQSIAGKLGMTPETLRLWVRRDEVDQERRPGVTSAERERIRDPEREVRELRRANEILAPAVTVPFASFVYFCNQENSRMNAWVNTPERIAGLALPGVQFMYPGDRWDLTVGTFRSAEALARYRQDRDRIQLDPPPAPVESAQLESAVGDWLTRVRSKLLNRLLPQQMPPFDIYVPNIAKSVTVAPARGTGQVHEATAASADAARYVMCSQVAWFVFAFPWGVDTVWISGMFRDQQFATQGEHPIFRLARREPREARLVSALKFRSVAQWRRALQFWRWEKYFRLMSRVRPSQGARREQLPTLYDAQGS